jgi:hypothetical protein
MIDLYAMGSPNVVKICIGLEEMGSLVPCTRSMFLARSSSSPRS